MTRDDARRELPGVLTYVLRLRGVRQLDVARELGVRDSTVSEWCRGIRFPLQAYGPPLADMLDWPRLADLVTAGHTSECGVCGRAVVQHGKSHVTRWCDNRCKNIARDERRRGVTVESVRVWRARWTEAHRLIAAHCKGCEPEGVCRDDGCKLRPMSPLPFIPLRGRRTA